MARRKTLTKESVSKWLDTVFKLQLSLEKNRYLTNDICKCSENVNELHIYLGIEELADILEKPLHVEPWDCPGSIHGEELYFIYKNKYKVFQLGHSDAK